MGKDRVENAGEPEKEVKRYYCSLCGREISGEDYVDYDGMCWDDQLTEESLDMFGDFM